MKYVRSGQFKKDFAGLHRDAQNQARKAFGLLKADLNHPSLRIKKMKGHEGIYEGHVSEAIVFTFEWLRDEETGEPVAYFRRIGSHGVYKQP